MVSYGDVRKIMEDVHDLAKYGNTVRRSAKERKTLCQEITDLLSEMDRIRGIWDRVKSDDQVLFNHTKDMMVQLFSGLNELLQEKPKGFRKILVALYWPWRKAKIEKALEDIRVYRNALTAIMVADIRELVADVPAEIKRTRTQQFIESYTPDISIGRFQVSASLLQATDGIGEWFLEEEKFKTWAESDNALLWVKGSAGSGKSGLAYVTSNRLARRTGNSDGYDVACVFCNHASLQNLKDPMDIVMSFWTQLVRAGPRLDYQFVDEFEKKYRTDHTFIDKRKQRKMEIFQHTAAKASGVILVLDGLDEIPRVHQRDVVNYLREVQHNCPKLRLMITSRPYKSIGDMFVNDPTFKLTTSASDLRLYILGRMKSERWEQKWGDEEHQEHLDQILRMLIPRCQGFFMCKLFMDEVQMAETKDGCFEIIKSLPETIQEALNQVLARLAKEWNKPRPGGPPCLAIQALFWVVFAKRPMTQSQMRQALAVKHNALEYDKAGKQKYDGAEKDHAELDLVRMCGELITIDDDFKTLRVIHKSVADHLVTIETRDFWFPNLLEHIPTVLLRFLRLDRMKDHIEDTSTEDFKSRNPLCPYALRFWGLGLAKILKPDTELWSLAETSLRESFREWNEQVRSVAVEALAYKCIERPDITITAPIQMGTPMHGPEQRFYPGTITGLHWAVAMDLPMFIPSLSKIPDQSPIPTTPLGVAVLCSRKDLATCLIDNGSKVNLHKDIDRAVRSPLHDAVSIADENMVSFLLENGADMTQRRGRFDLSPLDLAYRGGCAEAALALARWISNHPLPTKAQELQFLVRGGFVAQLKEAINKGLDVNHPCENGKMALDYAQEMGHRGIVDILKDNKAISNFQWPDAVDDPSPRPPEHSGISTMTPIVSGHKSWETEYLKIKPYNSYSQSELLLEIPIPADVEIRSIAFETLSKARGRSQSSTLENTYLGSLGSRFQVRFHHSYGDSECFLFQSNLYGSDKLRLHTNIWNLSELEVSSPRRADLIKSVRHPGTLQVFGYESGHSHTNIISSVRVRMYGTEVGTGH